MGMISRLTKQLFGRKQPSGEFDLIIDGEIVPNNKGPERAEFVGSGYESNFFETRPELIKKAQAKTESVFQEPEFIEPEPLEPSRWPTIQEGPEKLSPKKGKPGAWTVPEAYLVYLGSSGRAERTTKEYQWDLKWWNKQKPLAEITRQNIEIIINKMHPATARRKIAVLRSFAKWQLRDGNSRLHGEVGQIIPPKTPGRVPKDKGSKAFKYLSKKAKELCAAGDRCGIWLGLMLCCGLRISEIQTVELSHGNAIKVTGKGNKERLNPAPGWLRDALSKQYKYGEQWRHGRHLIWLAMKRMEIKRPHSLRHTYASELIRCGFRLEEVKDLLGHAKLDTTMIYAKVKLPNDVTTRLGVE